MRAAGEAAAVSTSGGGCCVIESAQRPEHAHPLAGGGRPLCLLSHPPHPREKGSLAELARVFEREREREKCVIMRADR